MGAADSCSCATFARHAKFATACDEWPASAGRLGLDVFARRGLLVWAFSGHRIWDGDVT